MQHYIHDKDRPESPVNERGRRDHHGRKPIFKTEADSVPYLTFNILPSILLFVVHLTHLQEASTGERTSSKTITGNGGP